MKNEIKNMLVIREEFVYLLDGDVKTSLVLSYLYYWQRIKSKSVKQAEYINKQAQKHGEEPAQYEGHLHYHKTEDIYAGTFGLVGVNLIPKAIKKLQNLGVLTVTKNPNPIYKFDNTKWFFLDIKKLEELIILSQKDIVIVSTKSGDRLNETLRWSQQSVDNNNRELNIELNREKKEEHISQSDKQQIDNTSKSDITKQLDITKTSESNNIEIKFKIENKPCNGLNGTCKRKSAMTINGKTYCSQHGRKILQSSGEIKNCTKSHLLDKDFTRLLNAAREKGGSKGKAWEGDKQIAYKAYLSIEDKDSILEEFIEQVKEKGAYAQNILDFIIDKSLGIYDKDSEDDIWM